MIREIKRLLQEQPPRSLRDLAIHFGADPETLRPMLQLLEDKGQIRTISCGCGTGCARCACCTCMHGEEALQFEAIPTAKAPRTHPCETEGNPPSNDNPTDNPKK